MYLFLCSQDIHELEIGLSNDRELLFCSSFSVSPEEHLKTLDGFLKQHHATLDDLTRVYVVTGPGSFTASRVSITLANALAFSKELPVFEIKNIERQALTDLIKQSLTSELDSTDFAKPFYDRPAQITQSKK